MLLDKKQSKNQDFETSLSKAIRLLPLVAARNDTGVNLTSVARLAGLSTATTRRLLQGLVQGELLSFDPYAKTYYLGTGVFDLMRAPSSPSAFDTRIFAVAANPTAAGASGLECNIVPFVNRLNPRRPRATSMAFHTVGVATRRSSARSDGDSRETSAPFAVTRIHPCLRRQAATQPALRSHGHAHRHP